MGEHFDGEPRIEAARQRVLSARARALDLICDANPIEPNEAITFVRDGSLWARGCNCEATADFYVYDMPRPEAFGPRAPECADCGTEWVAI